MAFTPINSSDALTGSPDGPSEAAQDERIVPSYNAATTVAAYLGRGEMLRKSTAKGKKRTSTANAPSKAKRRQTSNISDGLTVSKTVVEGEQGAIEYEIFTPATYQDSSSMSTKKKTTASKPALTATSVSTTVHELASTAAKPISVYSSKTTMDALDTKSVPTSVESAKACGGQGFTLYQGPASTASYSSSVAIAKPLMAGTKPWKSATKTNKRTTENRGERDTRNRRSARLRSVGNAQAETPRLSIAADFEEDVAEIVMVDLTESYESDTEIRPNTPPPRGRKLNTRDVDELEDYGGALLSDADRRALVKIQTDTDNPLKPIVRMPFPPAILDRSPVFGASSGVVLRTCFRVGEAMATGCHGVRNGNDAVIELYARVTASWREPASGRKQHFTFKDIYHDNPPYLEGTFELWQQAQLWDLDSKVFLGASKGNGIVCRAIARMKRDGQKWRLDVLSVWEATWEDVEYAAGIYSSAVGK